MQYFETIHCPRCGEPNTIAIDPSVGDQQYIEDCQVCCRPMWVTVAMTDQGFPQLDVRGEDDA